MSNYICNILFIYFCNARKWITQSQVLYNLHRPISNKSHLPSFIFYKISILVNYLMKFLFRISNITFYFTFHISSCKHISIRSVSIYSNCYQILLIFQIFTHHSRCCQQLTKNSRCYRIKSMYFLGLFYKFCSITDKKPRTFACSSNYF